PRTPAQLGGHDEPGQLRGHSGPRPGSRIEKPSTIRGEPQFMYPWAVVVAEIGVTAVIEMFLFLAALFIAVLWAWREGALRWV
ncbi:NADH-quinone oxidoreductase subunit A, partial [Nocardioides sp. SOB77]